MPAPAFMIQGTGSNVGKSLIVAGLCRYFTNAGLRVRPFKPQNMSNNAAVTADGGEIGRAQALQARACKVEPTVLMNPVLLKPEGDNGSQVIVKGKQIGTMRAADYYKLKPDLLKEVLESFNQLRSEADLVIVEGAGSASEVNLRANDIANMGFAMAANIPVYLAADIDRGGVIAALIGTHALLPEAERGKIKGFIINKFRGDPELFDPALTRIEDQTGWKSLGTLPWFEKAGYLPAEDSQDLRSSQKNHHSALSIIVPLLPRISNFDDLDPLASEPGVNLTFIEPGTPLPASADLIIIPGSKATRADLRELYKEGWDIDIKAHARRGGKVLGLCGGYQMLGKVISDPNGSEGGAGDTVGLGLLNAVTTMTASKTLSETTASYRGINFQAYEMHMGETCGPDCAAPLFQKHEKRKKEPELTGEGATSPDGRIMGTYLHGLFNNDDFRRIFLKELGAANISDFSYHQTVETTLDELAEHMSRNLSLDQLWKEPE